jgi:hypothetical protein
MRHVSEDTIKFETKAEMLLNSFLQIETNGNLDYGKLRLYIREMFKENILEQTIFVTVGELNYVYDATITYSPLVDKYIPMKVTINNTKLDDRDVTNYYHRTGFFKFIFTVEFPESKTSKCECLASASMEKSYNLMTTKITDIVNVWEFATVEATQPSKEEPSASKTTLNLDDSMCGIF